MSERKSWMSILRVFNLACAVLITLVIVLQFVPYWYDVGGECLNVQEYKTLKELGGLLPNGEAFVEEETKFISIAHGVWFPGRTSAPCPYDWHLIILIFGFWGFLLCIKNRKSSFVGIPATICGLFAALGYWGGYWLGENGLGEGIGWLWHAMIATLLFAAAVVLLVIHIRKIIHWFTLDNEEYTKLWK